MTSQQLQNGKRRQGKAARPSQLVTTACRAASMASRELPERRNLLKISRGCPNRGSLCIFAHDATGRGFDCTRRGRSCDVPRRRSPRQDSSTSRGVTPPGRFRELARRARRATTARPEPTPPPSLDDACLKHTTDAPMGTFRVRIDVDRVT